MGTTFDTPASGLAGAQSIDPSHLKPGDIILSTTSAPESAAIRKVSGSQVSHAMLYEGAGKVIESIRQGVKRRSLQVAVAEASLAVAFRRTGLDAGRAQLVLNYAAAQIGKKFDFQGLAAQAGYQLDRYVLCRVVRVKNCDDRAARNNLWLQSRRRFFCSELVAAAFRKAGRPLTDGAAETVSPQKIAELRSTDKLEFVGNLVG